MNETLIADCETDNLLKAMTKLWCIQLGTADGDEALLYGDVEFCDRPLKEGLERLRDAGQLVFHNGLGFDLWAINKIHPGTVRFEQVRDTLVLARMAEIKERNHSLEAWGRRTGTMKGSFKGPYDVWTREFADYSRQDIHAGRTLWHRVKHVMEWGRGSGDRRLHQWVTEHRFAYAMAMQEQNGVMIDRPAAERLHGDLLAEQQAAKTRLLDMYPPLQRSETKVYKRNNSKRGIVAGVEYVKTWEQEINLNSRQQIVEALQREGWKPTKLTPAGKPKLDEDELVGIGGEGPLLIRDYFRTTKLLGQLVGQSKTSQGLLQLIQPDDRVYGRINTLGAITWRCTHSKPNTANVDKDKRVRSLYIPRPGWVLVGCDGKEIQARFLAHYLCRYDNGVYAEKLVSGDKARGTDGHTLNLRSLEPWGLVTRDGAKTCQYARVFGCFPKRMFLTVNEDRIKHQKRHMPQKIDLRKGDAVRELLEDVPALDPVLRDLWADGKRTANVLQLVGQGAIDALGASMPGLDRLLEDVQTTGAERGYVVGIGGAQVPVAAKHAALVSLLQHGEATAMKLALGIVEFEWGPKRGWRHGEHYAYVTNVHDEAQTECIPEIAEEYGELFSEAIHEAGKRLGLQCDLGGEFKVGPNWAVTH
jgi:DNA polymerase-1